MVLKLQYFHVQITKNIKGRKMKLLKKSSFHFVLATIKGVSYLLRGRGVVMNMEFKENIKPLSANKRFFIAYNTFNFNRKIK